MTNEQSLQTTLENVWNNVLIQTLLNEEFDKSSIVFTDVDMEDGVFGENTPNELKQIFADPTAKKILKSTKNTPEKEQLVEYINEALVLPTLQNKYLGLIRASVYYPKWLFDKEQSDNQSLASINYINVPYSTIADSSIKITDEEIKAYVDKHKDQYKQEKAVTISYVVFDGSPTSSDSSKVFNELSQKVEEFTTNNDVNAFLNLNNSESKFSDLYVMRSRIASPVGDTIFNIQQNAVFGPYLDGNTYTLAKQIDKRILPDSVKCRHILIDTRPKEDGSVTSDSTAKARIDSISLAISAGANFSELALKYSDDPGSKDKGGEYSFSFDNFSSLAKPFAEYIYYQLPGSKSVIKTEFGYHLIEVLEHKNMQEAFKFAYLKRKIVSSDETMNYVSGEAMKFASSAPDKAGFEKSVKEKKLTARTAEFKTTDHVLMGLGNARNLIKWAFENNVGDISTTEAIGDYIVIATITEKKEEGVMNAKTARPLVEPILLNIKKSQQIIAKAGNQKDINSLSTIFKVNVEKADSVLFGSQFINPIGSEPKLIGASFYAAYKNKLSDPIAGNSGVFYLQVLSNSLAPSSGETYELKRKQAEENLKAGIVYKSIESLKKGSDIVDNRIKFY